MKKKVMKFCNMTEEKVRKKDESVEYKIKREKNSVLKSNRERNRVLYN